MRKLRQPAVVACRMLVSLLLDDEWIQPVSADLIYDTMDPYAVCMAFHVAGDSVVCWVFARDLLIGGRSRCTGEGDIRVWPSARGAVNEVCVQLRPGGEAERVVLVASARAVEAFLHRALQAVPAGTETGHLDLDDLADQLLNRPGRPHG
ncbi:SsgA family sporulation/cell division regulator [Streptomyces sp. NPDC002144]